MLRLILDPSLAYVIQSVIIIIVLYNRYVEDTFLAMRTLEDTPRRLVWADGQARQNRCYRVSALTPSVLLLGFHILSLSFRVDPDMVSSPFGGDDLRKRPITISKSLVIFRNIFVR